MEEKVAAIIAALRKRYPDALCALHYGKDYELMISVRLSAQCTDARVNQVTPALFARFPTLEAFAEADVAEVETYVRSCGFFHHKAQDIVAACRMLRDEYGGRVPDTMEQLLRLPGVGRKTANLLLGDLYGKPAVVCDTHCIRIANRLGLARGKEPEKVERQLRAISSQLAGACWVDRKQEIFDIVDGSYLERYHDYDKGVAFLNAATVSTTYMLLSRCGLAENAHFGPEDFMPVFDFNTPQTVDALGSAISGISEEILRNIEVTIKKYEREKLPERSYENGRTDLHPQRGLLDSQSESVPAGEQAPRQVREDAEEVSTGASPGAVEPTDPVGAAVPPSAGDRRDGEQAVGADDAEADAVGRGDGSSENQRPDEVGGADEQPESPGRGSDPDGADLHLTEDSPVEQFSFFPTEAQQIESITEAERVQATPSAFSMATPHKYQNPHYTIGAK